MTQLLSALFVDFDNVASELKKEGVQTETKFSSQPGRWLEAIRTALPLYGDGDDDGRRIVSRRCYASPYRIGKYRADFTRAGFEVIDCPPLTQHLKNSADIYMVMDIIDYVERHPKICEFIILSADADFTPLLNRLRREVKRTVIFSASNTASAYKSCSDQQIAPAFFSDVLNVTKAVVKPREAAAEAPVVATVSAATAPSQKLDARLVQSVEAALLEMLAPRNGLATFSAVAGYLSTTFAEGLGGNWAGRKTFTKFLREAPLPGVRVDWDRQVILIPNFTPDLSSWSAEDREALADFVTDVLHLYNVPLLSPEQYTTVLERLAVYWSGEGCTVVDAIKTVGAECEERAIPASLAEIRFIVTGIAQHGVEFGPTTTVREMAAALRHHIFQVCDEPEWMLEPGEAGRLVWWIRAIDEGEEAIEAFIEQVSPHGGSSGPEPTPSGGDR